MDNDESQPWFETLILTTYISHLLSIILYPLHTVRTSLNLFLFEASHRAIKRSTEKYCKAANVVLELLYSASDAPSEAPVDKNTAWSIVLPTKQVLPFGMQLTAVYGERSISIFSSRWCNVLSDENTNISTGNGAAASPPREQGPRYDVAILINSHHPPKYR